MVRIKCVGEVVNDEFWIRLLFDVGSKVYIGWEFENLFFGRKSFFVSSCVIVRFKVSGF